MAWSDYTGNGTPKIWTVTSTKCGLGLVAEDPTHMPPIPGTQLQFLGNGTAVSLGTLNRVSDSRGNWGADCEHQPARDTVALSRDGEVFEIQRLDNEVRCYCAADHGLGDDPLWVANEGMGIGEVVE